MNKVKDSTSREILNAIHALLNTDGGGTVKLVVNGHRSEAENAFIKGIEQKLKSIIGIQKLTTHITFEPSQNNIIYCKGKKSDTLITTNYHAYLPSKTEANKIPSTEEIDSILNRKQDSQPVPTGSHHKEFTNDKNCGFTEGKNTQFKCLTAIPSKRTKLADRMTGKGNKFSCYVSAFANNSGGHIYFGIADNGQVKGESIPSIKDRGDIINKVEKAFKKIIWPEQPKRGKQWEIFFQQVVDKNSEPVPSTFVIVIYIAPCLGGVFTEEPECYEIEKGKVSKMSLTTWKKRILPPIPRSRSF